MLFPLGVANQRNTSLTGLPLTASFITKSIERGYTPTNITIKNTTKTGDLPYTPIPELATFPLSESDKTDYKSDSFFTGLTLDEREYLSNYDRNIYDNNIVDERDCIAVPIFFIDNRIPSFWINRNHTMDATGADGNLVYYKPVAGGKLYTVITQQFGTLNGNEGPIDLNNSFYAVDANLDIIRQPEEFSGSMTFNFTAKTYTYMYASEALLYGSGLNLLDFSGQYRDVTVTAKRCTITSVIGQGSYYYNYNRAIGHDLYVDKPTDISYGPLTPCTPDQFRARNAALGQQYGYHGWSIWLQLVGNNSLLTIGDLTTSVNELDWSTNLHRHAIAFPASYGITSVTSSNPNVQIRKRQFSIAAGNGGQRLMDEWLISFPYALTTSITFSK